MKINQVLCLLVLYAAEFSLFSGFAAAQDIREFLRQSRRTGTSHSWTPHRWVRTSGYAPDENLGEEPDEETLESLRLQWGELEVDALGNFVTVRGQLQLQSVDDEATRPLKWRQGVSVYLAKRPNIQPNWSGGMKQDDTESQTALAKFTGEFEVKFDLREIKFDRSGGKYQFGVALAERENLDEDYKRVTWTSDHPAMAGSVLMLTIPAPTPLSRELLLINECRNWPFSDPDSVKLIRAVNALQPLGKDRALTILEEYISMSGSGGFRDTDIVFWIIRVLFEPIELNEQIPQPAVYVWLNDREISPEMQWPLNPMAVVNDIPFMLGQQTGGSGMPEQPQSHIEFARSHCVIRGAPLRPSANPLATAEYIINSKQFAALDENSRKEATRLLHEQAVAMASDHVSPLPERWYRPEDPEAKQMWQSKLNRASALGIRWQEESESFVADRVER